MLIKKRDTSGLVTATVLYSKITEVENKIPNTCSLVTRTVLNIKISEVENRFPDYAKYVTTPKFNKLMAENFATSKLIQCTKLILIINQQALINEVLQIK